MATSRFSAVAAKLAATAGVQRVPSAELELFIVRALVSAAECTALMALVDAKRRPSTIADDLGVERFRTSETCDLDPGEAVVAAVDARIAELLGLDPVLARHSPQFEQTSLVILQRARIIGEREARLGSEEHFVVGEAAFGFGFFGRFEHEGLEVVDQGGHRSSVSGRLSAWRD